MITISEVAQQFLSYIDETDRTFVNFDQVLLYIKQGYREFVRRSQALDNMVFVDSINIQFNNTNEYNLADPANSVCLIGPPSAIKPVGAKPFLRMVNFALWYPSPASAQTLINWTPVQDIAQFNAATTVAWNYLAWQPGYYILKQNTILLPTKATATFKLTYQGDYWPEPNQADTMLDDLGQFGDLIALLSARSYMVRDNTVNDALNAMLKERLDDLNAFLTFGRDVSGPDRVAILP